MLMNAQWRKFSGYKETTMIRKEDFILALEDDGMDTIKYFMERQYLRLLEKRKILYNADCDCDIVERVLLPLQEMASDKSNKPIEIIINTNGGSYHEALVLCNYIEQIRCPLTITGLGKVCSTGIYIMMAGKNNNNVTRRCYPFTFGLLHNGYQSTSGTVNQCLEQIDFTRAYEKEIRDYVLRNSSISTELYDAMYKSDWYFLSNDLLKHGIVDKIIVE